MGLQEDVLHHVLGIGGVAAEARGEAIETRAMQLDEQRHRDRSGRTWHGVAHSVLLVSGDDGAARWS